MSNDLTRDAYRTRFGNLTVKSILAFLCDQANDDGLCWPKFATIVWKTEISKRTVLRMVEVMVSLDLLTRLDVTVKGKLLPGFQIHVERLGQDLREPFAAAYARAQRKKDGAPEQTSKCRSDSVAATVSQRHGESGFAGVSATQEGVAATRKSVAATQPPHPHIGGTVLEPQMNPNVSAQADAGGGDDEAGTDLDMDLDAEQQADVERVRVRRGDAAAAGWVELYREQNRKAREEQARAAEAERERAALRVKIPNLAAGVRYVMEECNFAGRPDCELARIIGRQMRAQMKAGNQPWETASRMAENWKLQQGTSRAKLRIKYGAEKFFEQGHCLNSEAWAWVV